MKEEIGKDKANGEHMTDMLTIREVARLFHVHPNTLRRWSNNGRLRPYRINSRGDRRYKREEIAQFLAELTSYANDWQKNGEKQVVIVANRASR